jgi:spermidine synthase
MPTQVLCSLLPLQYAPSLDDVLVIGLASGVTAGAVSLVPEVKNLEVVELEPAIRRAAMHFGAHNHDVLKDPRLKLIHNDGRNHVLLSPEGAYDVIVSEPSNPWISGVSNLFTHEFFELGKTRLKPGGVWSQWVQMYGMGTEDLRTLLRTFAEVYPNVIVYATIEDADLVLLGSDAPLVPDLAHAEKLFAWPKVKEELAAVPVRTPYDIVALFQMDRDTVLEMAGDIRLNTDDNMAIEYGAPLNLHLETSGPNLELLQKYAEIPSDAIARDVGTWAELARAYHGRGDEIRSVATMVLAAQMLPEGDPEREELLGEARQWKEELEREAAELEAEE